MPAKLKRLIVATDGSANGERALSFAIAVARRHASNLVICNAVDHALAYAECSSAYGGVDMLPLVQALDATAASIVADAAKRAAEAGVIATTVVLDGRPDEAIVECARERAVNAIVIGTQGKRGLERFMTGSTADGVLRRTDVPVFVVPPGADAVPFTFDEIFVAVDDSDPSDAAGEFALALAQAEHGRLAFCTVIETGDLRDKARMYGYDPTPLRDDLRAAASRVLAPQLERARLTDVSSERVIAEGDRSPAEAILATATARHASLIVVGTHGRRGLRRLFLGSVAEHIVSHSAIPIAVVRTSRSAGSKAALELAIHAVG